MPQKILLLGSGALKIGQAGEFDYSGSQAIKACKEAGAKVILVNPNIATNQTSRGIADKVYFLPVTLEFVSRVIEKERPDSIMLAWGGQTALNTGIDLKNSGILEKFNIKVLGTPVEAIEMTEDRELFNRALDEIGILYPKSVACKTKEEARAALQKIGYPVIIRAAFTLGGGGSGFAVNDTEFEALIDKVFSFSPQILVEESLKGWKEIEYEVVRDANGNKITVCNMENFDPLGIHTGESIVIAPSQTLSDHEYQKLRSIALKVIEHLGIVGECNIQYALDPLSDDYRVIEVNARLSRSSALASKATGYPLAFVAAQIALGKTLPEIKNAVTGTTSAMFEPALDYVALKIPRWDLNKFRKVTEQIGSEMKSVGEVMALGRTFEEVVQKGLRMLQIGAHGLTVHPFAFNGELTETLQKPTPRRIFAIYEALKQGMTVAEISKITGIDCWFLGKLDNIVKSERKLKEAIPLSNKNIVQEKHDEYRKLFSEAKKNGFSDAAIEKIWRNRFSENDIRALRKELGVVPVVKKIDTLAAEFPAETNYLFWTYHGTKSDLPDHFSNNPAERLTLGAGKLQMTNDKLSGDEEATYHLAETENEKYEAYRFLDEFWKTENGTGFSIQDEYFSSDFYQIRYARNRQGKIIGACRFMRNPTDKTIWHIGSTEVLPLYRNLDIGTKLVKGSLVFLSTQNIKRIVLLAEKEAVGFWQKIGFVKAEPNWPGADKGIEYCEREGLSCIPMKFTPPALSSTPIGDPPEQSGQAPSQGESKSQRAFVLGSGPYSIGSSVEFDWCCVNAVNTLRAKGFETIMLNSNPETVSTDYETCDYLFFDELSFERTLDVIELMQPTGTVIFSGGQIPNNLAPKLGELKIPILGTKPENIDRAEDRHKFSTLCDELDIDQPEWKEFATVKDAEIFAEKVGFPVLVRPSKVLSGAAMAVARDIEELEDFLGKASKVDSDAPVVVSKFEVGAREIEIDAVAHRGEIILHAISEHVENAGVHSGDATIVFPPQRTYLETIRRIKQIARKLARALEITGPFNMQFLAKENAIKVIELNLRASRSFPFVSKVSGINFIEVATKAALGEVESLEVRKQKYRTLELDHVGVKCPQFSFSRLSGADPVLSVEMASTGEVGCFGKSFEEAFLKAMISVGFQLPKKGVLFSIGDLKSKIALVEAAQFLQELGLAIFATPGTADFFADNNIMCTKLNKLSLDKDSEILNKIRSHEIDLVINIPKNFAHEEITDGYRIRRAAIDNNIPLVTNTQVARAITFALRDYPDINTLPVVAEHEYF